MRLFRLRRAWIHTSAR